MPGIEFVGADADDEAADDVLDAGPRRPWPRWVWIVASLLVGTVVVAVAVSSRSSKDTPHVLPSPSADVAPSVRLSFVPAPAPAAGEQIAALTSDGASLFWLTGTRLYRAGPVGRASISASVAAVTDEFVEVQLVPDPAEHLVWVVSHGSPDSVGSGSVRAFSTTDLDLRVEASATSLITGAAVLDGALYVLSAGHLLRIDAASGAFRSVATVDAYAQGLVTVGASLWFVEGGNGSAIGRWTPGGGVQPPVVLTTTGSSLAAAGSTVFLVGTRAGRDVLEQLRSTGRPVPRPIDTGLSGQLQLVARGTRSVIVLGSGRSGLQLACVGVPDPSAAASEPRITLTTATSANVAVLDGTVFQAVGDGVRPATFGGAGCAG